MKIAIIGYSGSGKSTLASELSSIYKIPLLHMDKISFYANWVEKEDDKRKEGFKEFINQNPDNWVIDGNYTHIYHNERMEEADLIIFMNFNRFTCYFSALKRAIKYRNKHRESAPENCREKFSLDFQWWILHDGRTKHRKKRYYKVIHLYPNKVMILKNRKEVNRYLKLLRESICD